MIRIDVPSADLQSAVRAEQQRGAVLWVGSPSGRAALLGSIPALLFAAFFALFSLYWITLASNAPMPFPLFGVPFLLIGIYMLLLPFKTALEARSTVHMITERGVVTCTRTLFGREKTNVVLLDSIRGISRTNDSSGYGTLTLDTGSYRDSDGDLQTSRLKLYGISNAEQAEAAIIGLKSKAAHVSRA